MTLFVTHFTLQPLKINEKVGFIITAKERFMYNFIILILFSDFF